MSRFTLAALTAVVAFGLLAPQTVSAQKEGERTADEAADWTLPRTPDGRPDLQGYWTTQTFTPIERPAYLGDKEFYSEEEAAELQRQLTADGVDPLARDAAILEDAEERERGLYQVNRDPSYVHYDNTVWLRTEVPKGLSTRRTSLITDPPNGRIPPLTPAGAARINHAQAMRSVFDSHETRPLPERCIAWRHEGPPILPPSYNDIHQIFQTPDHVVVFTELGTTLPRMIPIDGRPHIADRVRQYGGDSRGYWDGDTLVVESKNFVDVDKRSYRGSSGFRHVVERFTRVSETTIHYEFTISDPTTWTSSWSAEVPMIKTEGPMFEYGCHEGNYDIRHILEINRNLERQAAEAAAAKDDR